MYGQDLDTSDESRSKAAFEFLMQNPDIDDETRKAKIALLGYGHKHRYLMEVNKKLYDIIEVNADTPVGDSFEEWFDNEIEQEIKTRLDKPAETDRDSVETNRDLVYIKKDVDHSNKLLEMLMGMQFDGEEDEAEVFKPTTNPPLKRGTAHSAGHDISTPLAFTLPARSDREVDTGVKLNIAPNQYVTIEPRSGLGFRHRIEPFKGIIDSDYKDNIKILMTNHSDKDYEFKAEERIAQLILHEYLAFDNAIIVSTGEHTGFGSTGRQ